MNGLGKRAIEAGWKWMPGTSADGMLVVDADESGLWVVRKGAVQEHWAPEEALPDLTDPATLGCLLALVREVKADPSIHIRPAVSGKWWFVSKIKDGQVASLRSCFKSEAEALVAALEAAE